MCFVSCTSDTPWPIDFLGKEREFDCFVVNTRDWLSEDHIRILATKLARSSCSWVEVFGFGAEHIHDAIDSEAVNNGRQSKVGEGDPMTSWNDERIEENELALYMLTGGQGYSQWKLILVIGEKDVESRISTVIETESSRLQSPAE